MPVNDDIQKQQAMMRETAQKMQDENDLRKQGRLSGLEGLMHDFKESSEATTELVKEDVFEFAKADVLEASIKDTGKQLQYDAKATAYQLPRDAKRTAADFERSAKETKSIVHRDVAAVVKGQEAANQEAATEQQQIKTDYNSRFKNLDEIYTPPEPEPELDEDGIPRHRGHRRNNSSKKK